MSDYNREQIKNAKDREDERRKKKAQTGTENVSILIFTLPNFFEMIQFSRPLCLTLPLFSF